MIALEASVQALVSDALAIAIARQLIENARYLGRQLIGADLIGILEGSPLAGPAAGWA